MSRAGLALSAGGDGAFLLGLSIVLGLLAFSGAGILLSPGSALEIRGSPLQPPSQAHPLGTDDIGRDVAAMIFRGVVTSIAMGVSSALAATSIGLFLGIASAVSGRLLDALIMRLVDFLLSVPSLVLALILIAFLKPSVYNVILVIAATSWPGISRIARAHSLQVLSTGYVEAARALGAGTRHVALKHLLPASIPIALASVVTTTRGAVLLEAGLSFLGLGDPNAVSLGTVLFYARRSAALASGAWWLFVPAGVLITLIVLGLTMISLGLERKLRPR